MKALFLSAANSTHTLRWVNSLAQRGVEVHLAYCVNHPPREPYAEGVFLHPLPIPAPAGYYLNAPVLSRLQKKLSCDLINAHYASGYGTLARLSRAKPLLLSVWGSDIYDFPYQSGFNMKTIQKNLLWADRIASTSKVMAEQAKKVCPSLEGEIAITPFGVETDIFRPLESQKERTGNEIVIGTVKGLSYKYGIDTLLEVFAMAAGQTNIPLKLKIYGDGPERNALALKAAVLGISKKVFWGGRIDHSEVPGALREMDVFCCFSRLESFGVAAVEAMAAGLPVVATSVGGFREVIPAGEAGFLGGVDDVPALAEYVLTLVRDKSLRQSMGTRGRAHVLEHYNWSSCVDAMLKEYGETAAHE